jgi:hypothetical protein
MTLTELPNWQTQPVPTPVDDVPVHLLSCGCTWNSATAYMLNCWAQNEYSGLLLRLLLGSFKVAALCLILLVLLVLRCCHEHVASLSMAVQRHLHKTDAVVLHLE